MYSIKFKYISINLLLMVISFSFSNVRNIKNDTLSKYSFEEIRLKILQYIEDEKLVKIYSDYYLDKAIRESNKEYIINGYSYKIDISNEKEALKYTSFMLNYIKKNDTTIVYKYYLKLGDLNYRLRKNIKSLKFYLIAFNKCDKNDINSLNSIKIQIAALKCLLCMYDESILILSEIENYCTKENPNLKLYFYSLQAENYLGKNKLERARYFINEGLNLSIKTNDNYTLNNFKLLESIYFFKKNYNQKSLDYLMKSINSKTTKNDFTLYSMTSYYIARNYEKLKQNEKAIQYFKKVDSIFSKNNDIYLDNIDAYNYLISYYKKNGDLEKELYYTKQLIKADKVFFSNNNELEKSLHKNYEIPKLQLSQRELERVMKFKQTMLIVLLSILFVVLIIVLIFYFIKKRKMSEKIYALKQDSEKYLAIHQNIYEQKNKNQTDNTIQINDKKKLTEEKKMQIKIGLELFESENGYLSNECSLEYLAKKINSNKTYLSQYLNENLGYTYTNYINNLRINHFIHLIKTEKKIKFYSLESIAELLGYNSVKVFSAAFKEKMDILPSVFIKNFNT